MVPEEGARSLHTQSNRPGTGHRRRTEASGSASRREAGCPRRACRSAGRAHGAAGRPDRGRRRDATIRVPRAGDWSIPSRRRHRSRAREGSQMDGRRAEPRSSRYIHPQASARPPSLARSRDRSRRPRSSTQESGREVAAPPSSDGRADPRAGRGMRPARHREPGHPKAAHRARRRPRTPWPAPLRERASASRFRAARRSGRTRHRRGVRRAGRRRDARARSNNQCAESDLSVRPISTCFTSLVTRGSPRPASRAAASASAATSVSPSSPPQPTAGSRPR